MSILSDYFSKTYLDYIPGHNDVFCRDRIFLNTNPLQGYAHSIHIPLNYTHYETLCNELFEDNKLMENQMFSVCVNKSCTSLRIVRFDGNATNLQESTVYETLKIEATHIFTLDFSNVAYTIDKIKRYIEKYHIQEESYSSQNYQNLARGYWTLHDGGILYVGCQQVLKDFTKILSKNERMVNNTEDHLPATKFREYGEMEYFAKLNKMEVETNPFVMFQIPLNSAVYFTLQDINLFVRKYAPMLGTQQDNNNSLV